VKLTEHEQKLFNEQIQAYQNMIKYFEQQIAKLAAKLPQERCCFENNRKRLPVIK
jgi:arylsulfatase A-like enzyme